MPCASATHTYDNEAFDAEEVADFGDANFLLAETQDLAISTAYAAMKLISHDAAEETPSHGDTAAIDSAPELLQFQSDIADDAVSLLLPEMAEMEPTAGMDCTNFVDFDEFNLCLSNILSDHGDVDLAREDMLGVGLDAAHHSQATVSRSRSSRSRSSSNSWNKLLAQNTQIDDILNVVQIGDESDEYDEGGKGTATSSPHLLPYAAQQNDDASGGTRSCYADVGDGAPKQQQQQQRAEFDAVGSGASVELDIVGMSSQGLVNMFQ